LAEKCREYVPESFWCYSVLSKASDESSKGTLAHVETVVKLMTPIFTHKPNIFLILTDPQNGQNVRYFGN